MQLIPVPVDHVRLQEVEQSTCDEEAVGHGKAFDVTHVQSEGVGGGGDGAQAHQLTDDVPHANTWGKKNNKNTTENDTKSWQTFV